MRTAPAIIIDNDVIPVRPDSGHEYTIETSLVAKGYGIAENVIRNHKMRHADELIEGKHWVVTNSDTLGGAQEMTLWTKRGVIRLGFFIRSVRARRFRDMAEDLIIDRAAEVAASRSVQLLAETVGSQVTVLENFAARLTRLESASHTTATDSPQPTLPPSTNAHTTTIRCTIMLVSLAITLSGHPVARLTIAQGRTTTSLITFEGVALDANQKPITTSPLLLEGTVIQTTIRSMVRITRLPDGTRVPDLASPPAFVATDITAAIPVEDI